MGETSEHVDALKFSPRQATDVTSFVKSAFLVLSLRGIILHHGYLHDTLNCL